MPITSSTILSTKYGKFTVNYHKDSKNESCVSIVSGDLHREDVLVRIHSSCLFSESFNTIDCDCSLQLNATLKLLGQEGGVIVYLYQEGRGVGLENKIKAMEIERVENVDTAEAFTKLHFELDPRKYHMASLALKELGIFPKIRLISNNPRKQLSLEQEGFIITELVKLEYPISNKVKKYLQVKKKKLGHLL